MRFRDRGFALMLVLVASAGAFALATRASLSSRAGLIETRSFVDRAESMRTARGAVVIALGGLLTPAQGFSEGAVEGEGAGANAAASGGGAPLPPDDENELDLPPIIRELLQGMLDQADEEQEERRDNLENITRLNEGFSLDSVDPSGGVSGFGLRTLKRFGLPARPLTFSMPGADDEPGPEVTVEFADAVGLLDINTAEEPQLTTYLRLKGVDDTTAVAIAQQLLDWRDEDSFVRPFGAERANYVDAGISIPNGRVFSVSELLYLPSMTREIFAMIRRDLITSGADIHANSAPYEVLASVPGMPAVLAGRIVRAREAGPLDERALKGIAPPGSDTALAYLRVDPSNLVRVRVTINGAGRRVYEGHAAIGDAGILAVSLSPVYDHAEPKP